MQHNPIVWRAHYDTKFIWGLIVVVTDRALEARTGRKKIVRREGSSKRRVMIDLNTLFYLACCLSKHEERPKCGVSLAPIGE